MTEEEILLGRLQRMFPEGTAYARQVRDKPKLHDTLNRISLSAGQTPAQWCAAHSLTWAETGYVEKDMTPRGKSSVPGGAEAFDLAHFVFRKQPLVGAYILTPDEDRLLYQASKETVKRFLRADYDVNRRECAPLILEAVRLIRGWEWQDGAGAEAEFWRYLFQQFGVHTENSATAEERLKDGFTMAIDMVFEFYKRLTAPKGRLQYSSTLLLHALAPRSEMYAFFRTLFRFYANTLHYQYRENDVGFDVLARVLTEQWNAEAEERDPSARERRTAHRHIGRPRKEDRFEWEAPAISGIHTLFRCRPAYAGTLCDALVRKMDLLVRDEAGLDTVRNYWDLLLSGWYRKMPTAERARIQEACRTSRAGYVAVCGGNVYVRCTLERERVGLEIPAVRLPVAGKTRPSLRLYQSGRLIFSGTLEVSGCVPTTAERFLPLDETQYDFSKFPELCAEIEYLGALLYRSGDELRRRWLMFDEAGNQRIPKSGAAWLFTADAVPVSMDGDGASRCDFPGQLWRMEMGTLSRLEVDGEEIFSAVVTRFRHHTSERRVDVARVDVDGKLHDILPAPFRLMVHMTEHDRAIRYRVAVDGVPYPSDALEAEQNELLFEPSGVPGIPHCVQVFDHNGILKDEYRYIILNGCRVSMDRRLYREATDEAAIRFEWNNRVLSYALPLPPGMDSVSLTLPGLEYPVEIDIPVVHCQFCGRNAFSAPEAVWHADLDPHEALTLRLPSGWDGQVMCGIQPVPADESGARFPLAAALRDANGEVPLWLSLWDGAGPDRRLAYPITRLMFRPAFLRNPVEIEDDRMVWLAGENFIGARESRFTIDFTCPDGAQLRFDAGSRDAVLIPDLSAFREGRYGYQVFLSDTSTPLYAGNVIVGDKRKFAFSGRRIVITAALYWDFDADDLSTIPMQPGCGILREICYQANSVPPGESVPAPEYAAVLSYTDPDTGSLVPFHDRADDGFEQVNPVTLWTVNEHLLILQAATGDTLYIDKRTASILYRNPDSVMSRDEQRDRLETPDYFEYRIDDDS